MFGRKRMQEGQATISMDTSGLTAQQLEVLEAFNRFQEAMCSGDVGAIDALIEPGTRMTHGGGAKQDKDDWLEEVASGSMRYYSSEIASADIRVEGDWAVIDPVCKLDARIWGFRKVWKVSIRNAFHNVNGKWLFAEVPSWM